MSKLTFVTKSAQEMSVTTPFGSVALNLEEAIGVHARFGNEIERMRGMTRNAEAAAAGVKQTRDGTEDPTDSLRA